MPLQYTITLSPLCVHGAVGPGSAVRMLLYADVETRFLAARVLAWRVSVARIPSFTVERHDCLSG